jgi:hypothetical protein
VEKDCEVLTGGTNPNNGFFTLIDQMEDNYSQILMAVDQRDAYHNTSRNFKWGEVLTGIGWGFCVILTEGLCLPLVGVFGGFVGLSINKDDDARIQETIIVGLQREIEGIEKDLRGRFKIGQAIYRQP